MVKYYYGCGFHLITCLILFLWWGCVIGCKFNILRRNQFTVWFIVIMFMVIHWSRVCLLQFVVVLIGCVEIKFRGTNKLMVWLILIMLMGVDLITWMIYHVYCCFWFDVCMFNNRVRNKLKEWWVFIMDVVLNSLCVWLVYIVGTV